MIRKSNQNELNWAEKELKNFGVRDGRILNRAIDVLQTLAEKPEASIPNACSSWAQTKATYRFFNNENWSSSMLLESHQKQTIDRCSDFPIILAIQDTTDFEFDTHKDAVGLGPRTTNKNSLGFFLHSVMAVSTDGVPMGFLSENMWARKPEEFGKKAYRDKLPIEKKESYKWLQGVEAISECFNDKKIVHVCDREADIIEFMLKATEEKMDFVIRARQNRRIIDDTYNKLLDKINSAQELGCSDIIIARNSRTKVSEKTVTLSVKTTTADIMMTENLSKRYKDIKAVRVSIIIAEEIGDEIGKIKWVLLTNQEINNLEDAIEKINWYKNRWKIERFHYVLKSGCQVENLQFESFEQFTKLIALYSIIAWRTLWIIYLSRDDQQKPANIYFEDNEINILKNLAKKTNTPTSDAITINEAVLLVSKMGGFLGRKHDGSPGAKVFWRGMIKLQTLIEFKDLLFT